MKTLAVLAFLSCITLVGSPTVAQEPERVLNVYNWSNYIDENVVSFFEQESGIKVNYDTFDSNLEAEQNIVAGGKGYDVVVPSLDFMAKQIRNGFFQRLDPSLLTNYGNLDRLLLKKVAPMDIENAHGVPYMWGTIGIGYNPKMVKKYLGEDTPIDSWDLVFNPVNLASLAQCGVAVVDEPIELYSIVLNYLGKDPNSDLTADYRLATERVLTKLTENSTIFDPTDNLNQLTNGEVCIVVGWNGDIYQAAARAKQAGSHVEIEFILPKEGTAQRVDMLAIPELAKNVMEAHEFINFLIQPDVAAANTNYLWYPNSVPSSRYLIDEEIITDEAIYPKEAMQTKLFTKDRRKTRISNTIENEWQALLQKHKGSHASTESL